MKYSIALWRTCSGRGYGPVARQSMHWMTIRWRRMELERGRLEQVSVSDKFGSVHFLFLTHLSFHCFNTPLCCRTFSAFLWHSINKYGSNVFVGLPSYRTQFLPNNGSRTWGEFLISSWYFMTTSTNVSFHNVKFCNVQFEFPLHMAWRREGGRGRNTIHSARRMTEMLQRELVCSNLLGYVLFLCTLAIVSLVVVTGNPNTIRVLFPLHNTQQESTAN